MIRVANITDDPRQKQQIVLGDGSTIIMRMEYKPQQLGWFFVELSWQTFQVNGRRIVTSFNMLHQFKNLIPFGLAVLTTDEQEPTLQQDFSSGRAKLYVLSAQEVIEYTRFLSNG